MKKYFCDVCHEEIYRNVVTQHYSPKLGKVKAFVTVEIAAMPNCGELCLKCLKKILNEGE